MECERAPITAASFRQATTDGGGGSISSSAAQCHQGPTAETSAPVAG